MIFENHPQWNLIDAHTSGIILTAGHNMSQTDGNSSDGDSSDHNPALTGTGCYKNYDHVAPHRKSLVS